jgi:hypothetical protein
MNIDDTKITRIEVINHAKNEHPIGRILTLHKKLGDFDIAEISIQDNGRTMKIFLSSLEKSKSNT